MTTRALYLAVFSFLFAMQGCVDCKGIAKKYSDCTVSTGTCTDCKDEYNAQKDICGCKCKDLNTAGAAGDLLCDAAGNPDYKTMSSNSKLCKDGDTTVGTGDALCP